MQATLPCAVEPQAEHLWICPDLHGVVGHLPSLNQLQVWVETLWGGVAGDEALDLDAEVGFTSWNMFNR